MNKIRRYREKSLNKIRRNREESFNKRYRENKMNEICFYLPIILGFVL